MAVAEVLLKAGLGKIGEKVLSAAGKLVPGVGTAFTLTSLVQRHGGQEGRGGARRSQEEAGLRPHRAVSAEDWERPDDEHGRVRH